MNKHALLVFVIIFSLLFSSCTVKSSIGADNLLLELLRVSGEDIEGNGYVYVSFAIEGELGFFDDAKKVAMYGENATEGYFRCIEEYAIFVSSRVPSEIAVFKCFSLSDTDTVARMCLERADVLKVALRGTSYEGKSSAIEVTVIGRYVVFCFAENGRKVEEKFRELI